MNCPLCNGNSIKHIGDLASRPSSRCGTCDLLFVHPDFHLLPEMELQRYLTHRNNRDDSGYLVFLERLIAPLVASVTPGSEILDFGSGPTPVMAELMRERGYRVEIYDPFFSVDINVLDRTYDAVACCETAEHFRFPIDDWSKIMKCMRSGSMLGVMTLMYNDEMDLNRWWYAQDPTHICFYSVRTMEWIAAHFGLQLEIISDRVALFEKR
ncbi:MAG: class I SAM-dependent methyltransferase [bacterium]|nr:class I SAM-dependent methyltransferase [bacterium]